MKYLQIILGTLLVALLTNCQALKLMKVEPIELNDQLHIVLGGGGNSAVLFSKSKDKVLIVDTKNGKGAKKLKKWINQKAPNAEIIIINTHFHKDHVEGNNFYLKDKSVKKIIIGDYTDTQWVSLTQQNLTEKYKVLEKNGYEKLSINGENVHIFNEGSGHTWSDIVVYFEKSKTLMTGDLVFHEFHPVLQADRGANLNGWIDALDDLTIKFNDPRIVPGHGSITDTSSINDQRQYLIDLREVDNDNLTWKKFKNRYKSLHTIPFYSGFKLSKKFISK